MATKRTHRSEPPPPADAAAGPRAERDQTATFPVVGVGASAGGLEAFTELLEHLPPDTGMGFVLVQHLDPQHASMLTELLSRATSLPVREITPDSRVEPNHVYVIPPNATLAISQGVLKLEARRPVHGPYRPIDAFFESLAADQRHRAIGVVLSGTASDGTLGLEAIKAEDGITFAQDESARHDSMPRSAVAAGCVDFVLSPAHIAAELARIAMHPFVAGEPPRMGTSAPDEAASAVDHEDDPTPLPSAKQDPAAAAKRIRAEAERSDGAGANGADNGYAKILLLLRNHSGVDFSLYKSTTVQRRITRRMVLNKQHTLDDYARLLRGNANELDALYSDALIGVTSFFRNPEAFDALQHKALPALLNEAGDESLRCWVLGCSTGQEAYSIAIAFVEAADKAPRMRNLQVFATDLNDKLLDKARHGLYAKSLIEDVTPERLRRFFVEEEGGWRVSKALREMVVFARQNLISDPPFSRMDLISCRNLLIYLEPALQKRALPTFHYALKPGGFLLLGASESIGGFTDLFEAVDKKHKIFARKTAPVQVHLPIRREHAQRAARAPLVVGHDEAAVQGLRGELGAQREADRLTINRFAPPGVLVDAEMNVLQFRGTTGAYLEPPSGRASFDVLKMAREGLMLPLAAAIKEAKKHDRAVRKDNVRVTRNGEARNVNLEVIPLKNLRERCFLIVFEEADGHRVPDRAKRSAPQTVKEELGRSTRLEAELAETRDYLQSMQEQHEAANEELQAANEEVQSANEELQSVNEELETSKEELESANEELTTVNEEMANRNIELNRLNGDLVNFQTSTRIAVVLLGRDLAIRRFTPQAEKLLDLRASDVGRPVGHIRHGLVFEPSPESGGSVQMPVDLQGIAIESVASLREQELEVRRGDSRWYSLRMRPYITLDNKVDGAVMVLVDIDDVKRSKQIVIAARDYAEGIVETVREPLVVLDGDLRVTSANRAFYAVFRVAATATVDRPLYELGNRQWDIPRLRELLENVLPKRTTVENFLVEHEFETIGTRSMLLNARCIHDPQQNSELILLAIEDVTERRLAERQLSEQLDELARFNRAAVGRELRMIELKKQINELRRRNGESAPYPLEFEPHEEGDGSAADRAHGRGEP